MTMTYARTFEEYEVRELLRNAEGTNSPTTNQPAHSRNLHALSTPGAGGTNIQTLRNRVHAATYAGQQSSAFKNLLQQAAAATQALNSPTGQAALSQFDTTTAKRVKLVVSGIRESSFIQGAAVAGGINAGRRNNKDITSSVLTSVGAALGVIMIIDKGPLGRIHIQTCYPSQASVTTTWMVLIA